jgi:hypothetical protein
MPDVRPNARRDVDNAVAASHFECHTLLFCTPILAWSSTRSDSPGRIAHETTQNAY